MLVGHTPRGAGVVPELSFSEVGEILHLLQGVEGSNIELEWGDLTIQVRRGDAEERSALVTAPQEPADVSVPGDVATYAASTAGVADRTATETTQTEAVEEIPSHWIAVSAPMAGTFYRASAADRPPYVEIGDLVSPGDTVALIEVMKLFTELKAEAGGKVARIDAADGTLIEFGQPLIWIEPA
jgi:acetyl-CoA carboxylase biotin carboxyl carrier protein